MNAELDKPDRTRWPGLRGAGVRIALITLVLLPVEWVIYALLVRSWTLELGTGTSESWRHLAEGTVILAGAVAVVFLASLLPMGRWFFNRRMARRLLIGLAWVVTLAALFYAEEDWRGARAWNKYRQQLVASGVQLDFAAYIPKPIPDDQNFAATPAVKSWFEWVDRSVVTNTAELFVNHWQDKYARAMRLVAARRDKGARQFIDLVAWAEAFGATRSGATNANEEVAAGELDRASRAAAVPAVLEGLKPNETVLEELRQASARPRSRYPVFYDLDNPPGIYLPHLGNLKSAMLRLQLRACAELASGQSNAALADVKLSLYLADSVNGEPFLISQLVRSAGVELTVLPVWEGLAEHAWSDAQLQELESRFRQYNFLADLQPCFDSERADGVLIADLIRKKGVGYLIDLMGPGSPTPQDIELANMGGVLVPRGWYAMEQVNLCRLHETQLEGTFDPVQRRVYPDRIRANIRELDRELSGHNRFAAVFLRHRILAALALPSLEKCIQKGAAAQASTDEAALACALERHRLANGQFPEKLEMLVPQFISYLPHDVLTGEPYKYRRTSDGRFVLYSVGWNEKDDGGVPGETLFDETRGDWVWEYPAK